MREMSRFAAIARGFMANELTASDLETKHKQLIRLIWNRNGMGERYYRVLVPDMPYNRFEAQGYGVCSCEGQRRDGFALFCRRRRLRMNRRTGSSFSMRNGSSQSWRHWRRRRQFATDWLRGEETGAVRP